MRVQSWQFFIISEENSVQDTLLGTENLIEMCVFVVLISNSCQVRIPAAFCMHAAHAHFRSFEEH